MRSIDAIVAGLVVIAVVSTYSSSSPPAQTTTQLEIEAEGGFAYVYAPNGSMLEIAMLKDSGDECSVFVDQLGTDLQVVSGNIIDAASGRATKKFDLTGAVVSFPDLDSSAGQLTVDQVTPRPATPCPLSGNPDADSSWTGANSLTCVPRLTYGGPSTDFPGMTLKPNWRDRTDGRVVLTRGHVTAMHPSDWRLKHTKFGFKSRLGGGNTPRFRQRLTDRVKVTAAIPSDRVEIRLNNAVAAVPRAESALSSIVVQPTAVGRPVRLKLIGRHSHNVPPALKHGDWVDHFCAFYGLYNKPPKIKDQLIPYVDEISAPTGTGGGQPSPGGLCPGYWP